MCDISEHPPGFIEVPEAGWPEQRDQVTVMKAHGAGPDTTVADGWPGWNA